MKESEKTYLEIDYSEHPGFSMYKSESPVDTNVIREVFSEIDTHLRLLFNTPDALPKRFVQTYFNRQIDILFNELEQGTLSIIGPSCWYTPIVPKALKRARDLLLREAIYRNENKGIGPIPMRTSGNQDIGRKLSENGCGFLQLPKEEVAKLWTACQEFCPEVIAKREKMPWEVSATSLKSEGRHWELLMDMLKGHGVFEGLSQFHNCPMDPLYIALCQSSPSETWYKDCYADVGLPTSQTAYMHFDGDFDAIKIILYLTEVGPANGPFSIIPRSRDLVRSYAQSVVLKYMDVSSEQVVEADPKYDVKYRRRRFKFPDLRKEMMKLPAELRGTSHFGEDVVDGTPLSKTLLDREIICTTEETNCVLFDGAQMIHRGGIVEKGERWALQLSYKRAKSCAPIQ